MDRSSVRCVMGLLGASLPLLLGAPARADDLRTARVSDLRGSLAVRAEGEDASYVDQNAILREGDVLWTDETGQAELELERGSWMRLAEDTKLEIRRLPPSGEFRLWTGSVYLDVSDRLGEESGGSLRLRTPVGDVDVLPDSVVRVDLGRSDRARVSLFSGRAELFPDRGDSVRLRGGERVYLEPDQPATEPREFDLDDQDGFDRYQRDRVDYYITRPVPRELDRDLLGARELRDHGNWVSVENVSYWQPRVGLGWRPYSSGYWSYVPGCGYSWVDYAPWGYATSHYGRWLYRPTYGWLWSPGYAWAPAYVSWASYGGYCGWAPLDPWNQPCYVPGSGFNLAFGTGNFFIDFRSWSFCPTNQFYYGRHHRRFQGGGGQYFYTGNDLRATNDGFRLIGDVHQEFGVPRVSARGLVLGATGRAARDSILQLENRLPNRRLELIESRFKVSPRRDRELALRPDPILTLQRHGRAQIDADALVRGPEASRRILPQVRLPKLGDPKEELPRRLLPRTGSSVVTGPFGRSGERDRSPAAGDADTVRRALRPEGSRRPEGRSGEGLPTTRTPGEGSRLSPDSRADDFRRGVRLPGSAPRGEVGERDGDSRRILPFPPRGDRDGKPELGRGPDLKARPEESPGRTLTGRLFPPANPDGLGRDRRPDSDTDFRRGTLLRGLGRTGERANPTPGERSGGPERPGLPRLGSPQTPAAAPSGERETPARVGLPRLGSPREERSGDAAPRPTYRDFPYTAPKTPADRPSPAPSTPSLGDRDSGFRRGDSGPSRTVPTPTVPRFERNGGGDSGSSSPRGGLSPLLRGGSGGSGGPSSSPRSYSPPSSGGGRSYSPPSRSGSGDSRDSRDSRGNSGGSRSGGSSGSLMRGIFRR